MTRKPGAVAACVTPDADACCRKELMQMGFDELATWLYSSGDILMMLCKLLSFIFSLETFAYIVSLVAGIGKAAR